MADLPAGTLTFLLTDIEASSTHWEDAPDEMRAALTVHDQIVADALDCHGGTLVKHTGDGNWCVFTAAPPAAKAAIDIQKALQSQPVAIRARLLVRLGLHSGEVAPTNDDYFGPVLNRMARVADLGNGDQIVCSSATAGLLPGFSLENQGMHELRGIGVDEIFMLTSDEFVSDVRPLRRPVVTDNLPKIRTSFLGREDDIDRTVSFLAEKHAVVTLLGPGGVGKTRLAIEVGAHTSRTTSAAVVFCDLADVREPDDVLATVADAIGARQQPSMDLIDSIVDFVHDRELLVILDNCEQVVDIVRSLVQRLSLAEGVDVLATSRAALRVEGEQLLDVSPLSPDDAGYELFVSRATEHDPAFQVGNGDEALISEITDRLDGIPLAIELAAARVRVMSPAELVSGLDDRFGLLRAGTRRGRQETLRDTVMWSYQLLSPQEAAVFIRLSVFAGGATLGDIAAVCADGDEVEDADIADIMLSLVEQSMVVGNTTDGFRRFRLLETMRQFGENQLADSGETGVYQQRHARHFATVAAAQNERVFSSEEHDAWRVLDAEWVNLRLALDTLAASDQIDAAIGLVIDLVQYSTFSMRFELFSWADELLELPGIDEEPRFTDLCGTAALGAYLKANGEAKDLAMRGLAANPDDSEGLCRVALASIFLNNVHTPEASDAVTSEWLATNPTTVANRLWAEGFRAFHLCSHGQPTEAIPHAKATARIAEETGSTSAHALAAWAQGMVVSYGDLDGAIAMWNEAREGPATFSRSHLVEHLLVGLVLHFTVRRRDVSESLENCRAALQNAIDGHYYAGASHLFGVTAIALSRSGDAETGAKLVGAMIGNGHLPRENATDALGDALGPDLERFLAVGGMMSVTKAGHLALEALDAALARHESAGELA